MSEHIRYRAATDILDILYDRALSRFIEDSDFDARDYLTEEEVIQWDTAQEAELEYMLNGPKQIGQKVVVEVLGGVAEVTSKPDNIEVEIIDHDNEE